MEGKSKPEKVKLAKRRNGPNRHAVGDAAQADSGSGTDTAQSSDWLAERRVGAAGAGEEGDGVAIDAQRAGDVHRGKALESKRGQ
jgi:hypothetical protein